MISLCDDGHDQVAYYGDVCPACQMKAELSDSDRELSAALAEKAELIQALVDLKERISQSELMVSALENKIQQTS